jgi:hypothetical protein
LSLPEAYKLKFYRMLPDSIIPDDFKGRLVINGYLDSAAYRKRHGLKPAKDFSPTYFESQILRTPGSLQSIYRYLNGAGAKHIPKIVEYHLGDNWYTGPAKLLARTPIGRNFVIDKIMDKTLPKINGDNSLAKQFLYAGGKV